VELHHRVGAAHHVPVRHDDGDVRVDRGEIAVEIAADDRGEMLVDRVLGAGQRDLRDL
jgi:hypothetical protein